MPNGSAWLCLLLFAGACGEDGEIRLLSGDVDAGAGGAPGADASIDGGTDATDGGFVDGGCSSSANCAGTEKFCNTARGRCVECLAASQCEVGKSCAPSGVCDETCSSNPDCSSGSRPFCLPGFSVCVECLGDADCEDSEKPFCESLSRECVECLADGHCETDNSCDPTDFQCKG
jgi:hypothetical protein